MVATVLAGSATLNLRACLIRTIRLKAWTWTPTGPPPPRRNGGTSTGRSDKISAGWLRLNFAPPERVTDSSLFLPGLSTWYLTLTVSCPVDADELLVSVTTRAGLAAGEAEASPTATVRARAAASPAADNPAAYRRATRRRVLRLDPDECASLGSSGTRTSDDDSGR